MVRGAWRVARGMLMYAPPLPQPWANKGPIRLALDLAHATCGAKVDSDRPTLDPVCDCDVRLQWRRRWRARAQK